MKLACILGLLAVLCSGCVWHRSCHVTVAPDSTTVELSQDWYGLIPGICGFTTHASEDYTFKVSGQKTEYGGAEIQSLQARPIVTPVYGGTLSIDRDQKKVVVDLTEDKHPFELNGTFHYH